MSLLFKKKLHSTFRLKIRKYSLQIRKRKWKAYKVDRFR